MNKTIIININGIIFHIEEDAYEVLRNYMTDVNRHFANEDDSMEITTDIENRVAEMFTEILDREARSVIVSNDVNTVIGQMGTVEDFEVNDGEQRSHYGASPDLALNRKLFRDPEHHLLGGVCSGIANYFDIDVTWVRLGFIITVPTAGIGFMAYIVLWIILPKAITRADKMAMKGENRDLKGFVKSLEDEVKNVHSALRDDGDRPQPFVYRVRDFVEDLFKHLRYFLGGAANLIIKLVGAIILLTCFGFFVMAVIALSFMLAVGHDVFHIFPFTIINHGHSAIIYSSAFIVAIIPLITIILLTLKVIFNSKVLGKSVSYTMLVIWIVAIGLLAYHSSRVAADFKEEASFSQTININAPANNTYYLKVNDIKYLTKADSERLGISGQFKGKVILNDDNDDDNNHYNVPQNVHINIEKSDVAQPVLVESFSARGSSYQTALLNSRNTTYYFNQQDSVLTFDRTLKVPFMGLWRNQEIRLTLKVPQNAKIVIDKRMERYINNVSLYDCNNKNKKEYPPYTTFIMTNNGLECKVDTLQTVKPKQ